MRVLPLATLMTLAACGSGSARTGKDSPPVTRPVAGASPRASSVPLPSVSPPDTRPTPTENTLETSVMLSKGALGHRVMRAERGESVVVDTRGAPVLSLGSVSNATFDPTGKLLYAWNDSTGVLYDVTAAKKIAERAVGTMEGAGFSRAGNRIIEVGEGIRIVSVPSLVVTFQEMGGHSEVHQTAARAFTIRHEPRPTGIVAYDVRLFLIDLDAEKVIGSIRMNEAVVRLPKFAFSADGKKMSWTYSSTSVWDTTTNKIVVLEKGDEPMHPRYEPGPAYFAPDGNSVCIEQLGRVRAISIKNVPKGTKRHCFIARRARGEWVSEISQSDEEALIVDIPFAPGTEHPGGNHGLYYRVTTEAMHPERRVAAVIEQTIGATPESMVDAWLVIAQAATGKVGHRISLPKKAAHVHRFDVDFSSGGKIVTVWNGDSNEVVAFDVATGAAVAVPADFKPPE